MTYYMRVFGVEVGAPKVSEIRDWAEDALGSIETVHEDSENRWQEICLLDENGDVVALLTRDIVDQNDQDSVGADDVNNFLKHLESASPKSAAAWLNLYLSRCTVVYCLEITSLVDKANGWNVVREVIAALRDYSGGISHAEGLGFSNEDGYHITWESSDNVDGDWHMAVRDGGQWLKFRMNMASNSQRKAFLEGKCPAEAVLIED